MIETNWYVITGRPSSGASKIIEHLAFLGYPIVPEAARILIDSDMSRGKTINEIRADEAAFQRRILPMKIDAEERIPVDRLTFFDRGIPCSSAYYRVCGEDVYPVIQAAGKRRYRGVFFVDPLPFKLDYARIELEETAHRLERLLLSAYEEMDYKLIHVPVMPIDERAHFILSKL